MTMYVDWDALGMTPRERAARREIDAVKALFKEVTRMNDFDEDSDVTLGCIVAGRILRAVPAMYQHKQARAFVLRRMSNELACRSLEAGVMLRGDEAVAAAERLVSELGEQGRTSPDSILDCALQRDDIASLANAVGSAILSGNDASFANTWRRIDETIAGYGAAVDVTIAPHMPKLRSAWNRARLSGARAPDELLAVIGSGSNPWWLDLVDPAFT